MGRHKNSRRPLVLVPESYTDGHIISREFAALRAHNIVPDVRRFGVRRPQDLEGLDAEDLVPSALLGGQYGHELVLPEAGRPGALEHFGLQKTRGPWRRLAVVLDALPRLEDVDEGRVAAQSGLDFGLRLAIKVGFAGHVAGLQRTLQGSSVSAVLRGLGHVGEALLDHLAAFLTYQRRRQGRGDALHRVLVEVVLRVSEHHRERFRRPDLQVRVRSARRRTLADVFQAGGDDLRLESAALGQLGVHVFDEGYGAHDAELRSNSLVEAVARLRRATVVII